MSTSVVYAASWTTITISLASLATSSFTAGQEATAVTNSVNGYNQALVGGYITVGTTPTANTTILIYAFSALDETPTWPDVFDGTDSAETVTSVGIGNGFLRLGARLDVDSASSNRIYPFTFELSSLFDGVMPRDWGLWVTHNTGVNLNATGGNHVLKYLGIKYNA